MGATHNIVIVGSGPAGCTAANRNCAGGSRTGANRGTSALRCTDADDGSGELSRLCRRHRWTRPDERPGQASQTFWDRDDNRG
jgi:hypothetical protein